MTECQCGGQPDGPHTDICYLQGEIERLRAEVAEVKKPDCADCTHLLVRAYGNHGCELHPTCVNGDKFSGVVDRADRPIRLYEIDAAMAGGE